MFPIYNFLLSLLIFLTFKYGFQMHNAFYYGIIFFSCFPIYIFSKNYCNIIFLSYFASNRLWKTFNLLNCLDSLVRIVRLLKSKLRLLWHFDTYCSLRALRKNLEVYVYPQNPIICVYVDLANSERIWSNDVFRFWRRKNSLIIIYQDIFRRW